MKKLLLLFVLLALVVGASAQSPLTSLTCRTSPSRLHYLTGMEA